MLGLVWFSNLQLHWKFQRLFETIRVGAFFVLFLRELFFKESEETQTRKNRKNVIPCPVDPRYIKGPRDLVSLYRLRSFSIYDAITGEKKIVRRSFEVLL